MKYTLKVSKTFFDDHQDRGLITSSGEGQKESAEYVIRSTKTHRLVCLSESDAIELLSDAEYYSTEWRYMGPEYFGLGRSAVSTMKTVATQMIEQGYMFTENQARRFGVLDRVLSIPPTN
jgi:hypothetical protein